MANSSGFKRGDDFPNEGFIQKSIENYFSKLGYDKLNEKYVDYVALHPISKERWVIEAKGESKAIGTDFNTCIGQIIKRMDLRDAKYAIAIPETNQYLIQIKSIKPWVRNVLQLHWILVNSDGDVKIIAPNDEVI